jgi:hypothetical protein
VQHKSRAAQYLQNVEKNITLRMDEQVLRKARYAALEANLSVSKWVAELIARNTTINTDWEIARQRALEDMESGLNLGGKPLSREEIYER